MFTKFLLNDYHFPDMRALLLLFLFPILLFCDDCKVYFSPKDHLADRLIELIDKEDKSIKVAAYSLTHLGIAKALIEAKKRGVAVEILVDPFSIKARASLRRLVEAKVPLFVWDKGMQMNVDKRKGLMHDKFCIFGDHLVWTGSFNFTYDANARHQENAVTIENREIAMQYLNQFSYMKLYESRAFQDFIVLYPKKKRAKKEEKKVT